MFLFCFNRAAVLLPSVQCLSIKMFLLTSELVDNYRVVTCGEILLVKYCSISEYELLLIKC